VQVGRSDSYSSLNANNPLGLFGGRNRTKSNFDISTDKPDFINKMGNMDLGKKAGGPQRSQSDFNLALAPKFGGNKKNDLMDIAEDDERTEDNEIQFEGVDSNSMEIDRN